tara:strand:- start:152 stop:313 length:162 start_codon:yes stop_codon:yes gene_type:complete
MVSLLETKYRVVVKLTQEIDHQDGSGFHREILVTESFEARSAADQKISASTRG